MGGDGRKGITAPIGRVRVGLAARKNSAWKVSNRWVVLPIAHCAVRADRRESTVIRKSSRAIFSSSLPLLSDSFVRAPPPSPLATLPFSRTGTVLSGCGSGNSAFP